MTLTYTITDSPLDRLLIAWSEAGVCDVCLGDSDEVLEAELRSRHPGKALHRVEAEEQGWGAALGAYLEGARRDLQEIPLDVQGSAFQWEVWQALREIPYGATCSYGDLAARLGRGGTDARAIGTACASNPVALLIPCHRVLREDGALGGFRWGLERKRWLLAMERGQKIARVEQLALI